jgi:hypothetical protein
MKQTKFHILNDFGLDQFMGIASPADVRPNLYGVD